MLRMLNSVSHAKQRDTEDVLKILSQSQCHNLFSGHEDRLRRQSSGIAASVEDDEKCDIVDDVHYTYFNYLTT